MRHPEDAYVRPDGIRDLTVESRVYRRGAVVTVNDEGSPRVVQLNLTPELDPDELLDRATRALDAGGWTSWPAEIAYVVLAAIGLLPAEHREETG